MVDKLLDIALVLRVLHDLRDQNAREKLLLVRVLLGLVIHHVYFVVEGPEGNKLIWRKPGVLEVYFQLDPVQNLLDVDQSGSDFSEKSTWASRRVVDDLLIDLHVKTDQLHV